MSAFLGPIHHIMYGKIKLQDGLCDAIFNKAEAVNRESLDKVEKLKEKVGEIAPAVPDGQLADIVDHNNIHGSLQTMVHAVEKRLAATVAVLMEDSLLTLDDICQAAYEFGLENSLDENLELEIAYGTLNRSVLNGMPCDRVEEILSNNSEEISWRNKIEIHGEFWSHWGRDVKEFYTIRENFTKGLLEKTNVTFTAKDGVYKLTLK